MGKPRGFIDIPRSVSSKKDPAERLKDYEEYIVLLPKSEQGKQGARCMDCGIPFCQSGVTINSMTTGCPLGNLIPEWNDLIFRGKWDDAILRLHKTNNFPEFTGRVCPAPCEAACTVALHGDAVSVKENECSIIERAFEDNLITAHPPKVRTGKAVAIVGSGPAGLAVADQLNKVGHTVTVFERADRVGGLLMYGIPNMKLDKKVIDRRVSLLEEEGITFKTNAEVGVNVDVQELYSSFDAVVLACGATKPRDITAIGRGLNGVHFAVDFLTATTRSLLDSKLKDGKFISAEGKRVVIIGGGDTGTDCVATSLRHGCKNLMQIEIMDKLPPLRTNNNPWPQFPKIHKTDYGQLEFANRYGDDPRTFGTAVKEFIGNNKGDLVQVKTVKMQWRVNPNGGILPAEVPNSEEIFDADLVLLAMGFVGPEVEILKQLNVETDSRTNVKADYGKFTTNIEKVFACGDVRRGQSLVVWAINEGRECAKSVDKFLMGYTIL